VFVSGFFMDLDISKRLRNQYLFGMQDGKFPKHIP
jgi:hypothetical protein